MSTHWRTPAKLRRSMSVPTCSMPSDRVNARARAASCQWSRVLRNVAMLELTAPSRRHVASSATKATRANSVEVAMGPLARLRPAAADRIAMGSGRGFSR